MEQYVRRSSAKANPVRGYGEVEMSMSSEGRPRSYGASSRVSTVLSRSVVRGSDESKSYLVTDPAACDAEHDGVPWVSLRDTGVLGVLPLAGLVDGVGEVLEARELVRGVDPAGAVGEEAQEVRLVTGEGEVGRHALGTDERAGRAEQRSTGAEHALSTSSLE